MGASSKAVDFSGVKERGNFNPKQVSEGDYAAKIVKVEDGESSKDKEFQYIFTIKLEKFSQNSYPYYCKLQENQLWKLRNIAVAAGLNVPKRRVKFDPNKVVGKSIGVTMEDDEYEGKMKSVVGAVFPISELADGLDDAADDSSEEFDEGAPVVATDDAEEFDPEAADEPEAKPKKDKGKKAKDKDSAKGGKKKGKKKGKDVDSLDVSDV
jgi:hypothetical protein